MRSVSCSYIKAYTVYTVLKEPQKRVPGVRISAHLTLQGLEAVVTAAAIVNFILKRFASKISVQRKVAQISACKFD